MSSVTKVARNNALWCDLVCRAHGVQGEFHPSIWINRNVTPSFYPNAITLSGPEDTDAQLAIIWNLLDAKIPGTWAVKDSFAALELTPLGFRQLFEAHWLWRSAGLPVLDSGPDDIRWSAVREPSELSRWEDAWSGSADPVNGAKRIFLPALLDDHEVLILAGYKDQVIAAGAIAYHSEGLIGISNVFVPEYRAPAFWAGITAAIMERFPGLPLVGYEQGQSLEIARSLRFDVLSPLRVWVRDVPPVL